MANTTYVPAEERRALCAAPVTLNGQPATISGTDSPFALVRTCGPWTPQNKTLSADWAWHTVREIVAKGGAFKL